MTMLDIRTLNSGRTGLVARSFLLIGALLLAIASSQVQAKNCRKVHLEVRNQSGHPIKFVDLDYWDSESEIWRSEPVRNVVIKNNRSWQETRTLERVYKQDVKIRAEYKTGKWNKLLKRWVWSLRKSRAVSAPQQCVKNTDFLLTLDN
ncbi:hypothetical protein [Methylomonas sp. MgM2]